MIGGRKRLIGIALISACFTTFLVLAALRWMGSFLVVSDEPVKSDAIIVLSGSIPDRALEAAELFREGMADMVILLHGELSPAHRYVEEKFGIDLPDDGEINGIILRRLGMPRERIIEIDKDAGSTEMEARVVKSTLRKLGIKRVLIVTSKYHTRRARMIFRSILGKGIEVRVIPSRYDDFAPTRWWRERRYARQVALEYQKIAAFWIGRLFGGEK